MKKFGDGRLNYLIAVQIREFRRPSPNFFAAPTGKTPPDIYKTIGTARVHSSGYTHCCQYS